MSALSSFILVVNFMDYAEFVSDMPASGKKMNLLAAIHEFQLSVMNRSDEHRPMDERILLLCCGYEECNFKNVILFFFFFTI